MEMFSIYTVQATVTRHMGLLSLFDVARFMLLRMRNQNLNLNSYLQLIDSVFDSTVLDFHSEMSVRFLMNINFKINASKYKCLFFGQHTSIPSTSKFMRIITNFCFSICFFYLRCFHFHRHTHAFTHRNGKTVFSLLGLIIHIVSSLSLFDTETTSGSPCSSDTNYI